MRDAGSVVVPVILQSPDFHLQARGELGLSALAGVPSDARRAGGATSEPHHIQLLMQRWCWVAATHWFWLMVRLSVAFRGTSLPVGAEKVPGAASELRPATCRVFGKTLQLHGKKGAGITARVHCTDHDDSR